jgi:hypothetical protein
MSDTLKVLGYLKTGRPLTVYSAGKRGLTQDLRSRISDLINKGHVIEKDWVTITRIDGAKAQVREYRLCTTASQGA